MGTKSCMPIAWLMLICCTSPGSAAEEQTLKLAVNALLTVVIAPKICPGFVSDLRNFDDWYHRNNLNQEMISNHEKEDKREERKILAKNFKTLGREGWCSSVMRIYGPRGMRFIHEELGER